MDSPIFAIAKFVPDLTRMEPRNCGVVVWNRGVCAARFVGDDRQHDSREIARLELPSKDTYYQWVEYWRMQMAKPSLREKSGCVVPRDNPKFLSTLCESSLDNFVLAHAGKVSGIVSPTKTAAIATSLYESVVTSKKPHAQTPESSEILQKETNRALKASGLTDLEGFRRSYDWLCPVGDTMQHFHFHFAIHKTSPEAVLQKVNLHRQVTVNDAAFMFQAMQAKYVAKNRCGAIVYASDADLKDDAVYQSFKLMASFGTVVNVADHSDAIGKLAAFASIAV